MKVGSTVIYRQPGIILTGKVEEVSGDCVRMRLESPWGEPCAFAEWFLAADVELAS